MDSGARKLLDSSEDEGEVPKESGWFSSAPTSSESKERPKSTTNTLPPWMLLPDKLVAWLKRLTARICNIRVEGDSGDSERTVDKYHLYSWRWFMLLTLTLLNISNGTLWLTFAPIPNYSAVFYRVSLEQIDWFAISFFVVSLLIGFVAIAILDIFGLKLSIYLGAGFNLLGSILRLISTASGIICSTQYQQSGFMVAMMGQVFAACAQPFLLYAPTKLANFWFSPKERALCTGLASLGNPLGLAAAQLISSNVVTAVDKFPVLQIIYTAPAGLGALLTVFAFWKNMPPVAPAPSSQKDPVPFFKGLKQVLTTPSFLFLLVVWGPASGLFNAILTLLVQMLCPFGYSDMESALWGAVMIFCGVVGATIVGVIIDYTKLFKEVAVVSLSLAVICFIWFFEVFSLRDQGVNIAFSVSLFGFFAFPLIPACMELGVEVTYPVSEATSSGLLWSTTQVMGIVMVLVGQSIPTNMSVPVGVVNECNIPKVPNSTSFKCLFSNATRSGPGAGQQVIPKNFTYSILFYLVVAVLALMVMVFLFRPKYKRVEMESRANELDRLQEREVTPSSSTTSLAGSSSGKDLIPDSTGAIKMTSNQRQSHSSTKF